MKEETLEKRFCRYITNIKSNIFDDFVTPDKVIGFTKQQLSEQIERIEERVKMESSEVEIRNPLSTSGIRVKEYKWVLDILQEEKQKYAKDDSESKN